MRTSKVTSWNSSPQDRPRTASATSADLGVLLVARQVERAADHQPRHLVVVGLGRHEGAAIGAVAQHADAVGDREDFLHAVRDVDDADAAGPEVADHVEEDDLLGVGERGGGLVEDDGLGIHSQRAGDLDHLLLGDRQPGDPGAGLEVAVQTVEDRAGLGVQAPPVHPPEAASGQLAQEDVLGRRHLLGERELLVDEHDTFRLGLQRRAHRHLAPAHEDATLVGLVHAGEHLHQGGLAGAVLAQERMHLAGADLEAHPVERAHAGESLDDALEAKGRGRIGGHACSSPSRRRLSCLSRTSTAIRIVPRMTST